MIFSIMLCEDKGFSKILQKYTRLVQSHKIYYVKKFKYFVSCHQKPEYLDTSYKLRYLHIENNKY